MPGKYKVIVNTVMPPTGKEAANPVPIDPMYSNLSKTPFSIEVSDSAPAGAYDLSLKK